VLFRSNRLRIKSDSKDSKLNSNEEIIEEEIIKIESKNDFDEDIVQSMPSNDKSKNDKNKKNYKNVKHNSKSRDKTEKNGKYSKTFSDRFYKNNKSDKIVSNDANECDIVLNCQMNDISAIDSNDLVNFSVPINIPNGFINLNSPMSLQSCIINCNYVPQSCVIENDYVCDLTQKVEGNDGPLYSNVYLYNKIKDEQKLKIENKLIPFFDNLENNFEKLVPSSNKLNNKTNKIRKNRFLNKPIESRIVYEIKN
jgi:hypothetical protein